MEPMTSSDFPHFSRRLGFVQGAGNFSNKIWIFWNSDLSVSVLRDLDQEWSQERLDRVLINTKWGDVFQKSTVSHLARVASDHSPFLFLSHLTTNKAPAAFRYMHMWARHHTFLNIVKEAWEGPTGFSGLKNLHHKLIRVKQRLKWWNKNIFGNVFDNLKKVESKVIASERLYDSSLSVTHLIDLKHSIVELILATKIEEDFWHQKSSCKWIVEGERNTKYFHNLVRAKRIKSRIHSIIDEGQTLTSDHEIQKSCVKFFSSYLSNDVNCLPFDGHDLVTHLPASVSLDALCANLCGEIKT
ncbi:hypothetical protein DH2020_046343 [Rehmannia glutinosa]|uniref:Uncharacterized protein n=1 Tax=Rehmannia glutinosa TaxID=99300 RepID=A0ABR0UBQ7_REHGL